MLVDPLVLFAIYFISVISLAIALYALVMLKELNWYYEILYKRTKPTQPSSYTGKYVKK